jgi:putative acyl-CoA dehydrogenase
METHAVHNQAPPLDGYNLFTTDRALNEAVEREGANWIGSEARRLGEILGSEQAIAWGFDADRNPPQLHTHDPQGERIDEVRFHPAWHELMRLSVSFRLHNLPWHTPRPGAHVARAGLFYLASQNEAGNGCPISMTYASVPALRQQPEIAGQWEPRIAGDLYDSRFVPSGQKSSVLVGMAMTEKQGCSDVRANTSRARAASGGGPGTEYRLTEHK